ncbi:aminotransferase class III-fold pyridoxal phosphate-dependent enzyme [Candidatus Poriferisodalis sp.]|uniref:aminotransferase class III-fold pyridoxal phosphate-dependent enzyme n=1 Tax=Candidatus Poriferisodalis sp. TaxID=3101277 RepID=UPI003B5AE2AF
MNEPMQTPQSRALYERAQAVIPKGVYGHYGPAAQSAGPVFFSSSNGAHFTDVDGNTYIDWMCAYGPMILGYNHPKVDQAAARQMAQGNTVSIAAPVLVDLAERLVDMVDGADWALFGKNGADSTGLAVMVARAATGRKRILKIQGGYHGSAPWMQTPGNTGTIAEDQAFVIEVPWNDAAAIRAAIAEHPDDIACFISSPYHHPVFADNALPDDGYWAEVEQACRAAGVAIIVDDVRSGFRIDLAGSHTAYGFTPDLMCFGKALGNGHPIAALAGSDALKQAAGDTFYTGTQFFNAAPMAAALATLEELEAADAATAITEIGERLGKGLADVAAAHGHDLRVTGVPSMPYLRIIGDGGSRFHARWISECMQRGAYVLSYHNKFVSLAHSDEDIDRTCDIADQAFTALA